MSDEEIDQFFDEEFLGAPELENWQSGLSAREYEDAKRIFRRIVRKLAQKLALRT